MTDTNIIPISSKSASVDLIRAEVKKSRGVEEGTIIRFEKVKRRRMNRARTISETVEFEELASTYAALFVGGKWYLTGGVSETAQGSPYTSRAFFDDVISGPDIRNIEVAVKFDAVDNDPEEVA